MTVAHAPGPWAIDDRSLYDGQSGIGMAPVSLGNVVADCPTAFGSHTVRAPQTANLPCPKKEEMDAVGLANARLIAAAPELLEALRAAMRFIESNIADPDLTDEMARNWMALQEANPNAAIAKAEGRS